MKKGKNRPLFMQLIRRYCVPLHAVVHDEPSSMTRENFTGGSALLWETICGRFFVTAAHVWRRLAELTQGTSAESRLITYDLDGPVLLHRPRLIDQSEELDIAVFDVPGIKDIGCRPRKTDLGYIDATTQYRVIAELLEPQTAQFFILMHEAGVALQRENWGEHSVRWEYRDDKGKLLGRGFHSVNDMCWKLADSGLLTPDLRGNVSLSERGHAFADWLVQSGYKVPHFWCDHGSRGTQAKPFKDFEDKD